MILKSFEEFAVRAEFDIDTGRILKFVNDPTSGFQGDYVKFGDVVVALYRKGEELHLQVGLEVFKIDGEVRVRRWVVGGQYRLQVDGSGKYATIHYPHHGPEIDKSEDLTPFFDDEDFDFGLFLSNLSASAERRSLIYRA